MKSMMNHLMVAAVAMAAVAGVASAQTLKVEVPFAFRASGTVMPAGTYYVVSRPTGSGVPIFRVLNLDAKRGILASAGLKHEGASNGEAKLVFRCYDSSCTLAQIWTGSAVGAYDIPMPKLHSDERAALVEIPATRPGAE